MTGIAVVTGADRGLGQAITARLLGLGWRVVAGQYMPEWPELDRLKAQYDQRLTLLPLDVTDMESIRQAAVKIGAVAPRVDMLVNNAGVGSPTSGRTIDEAQDYAEMHRMFDTNALGPLRMVEALLPQLEAGSMRRLAFVSSEAGSINASTRTASLGYCMSKAALNMGIRIVFNHLRPRGYTFRVYHPGWVRGYMSGTKNMSARLEPEEAAVPAVAYFVGELSDEERLVLRDWQGREWPW